MSEDNFLQDEDMDEENPNLLDYLEDDTFDAEETVDHFLETWSAGDYSSAYDMLAADSAIREEFSQEAWVERRQKWADEAKPAIPRVDVAYDYDREEDGTTTQEVEVFLSLEMQSSPPGSLLKELPVSTLSYSETGRYWSWARYIVVRASDDDEWRIQSMKDEGAATLQLSIPELEQRIEDFRGGLQTLAQKMGIENLDNFDPDNLDDINEEDIDDETLAEAEDYLEQVLWMARRGMHYADALIAQTPQERTPYENAATQAVVAQDWERAAAYFELISQHFTENRGEALRNESIMLSRLVEDFEQRGMYERTDHFADLVEKRIRDSIAIDNAIAGYGMLADILIDNKARHAEAEDLLRQAQALATNAREEALVASSFGRLAAERGQHQEALRQYLHAAELDLQVGGIWARIGREQRLLLDYSAAEQSLSRSIEQEPEVTSAYADLAFIYTTEQNQVRKARELLELAMDIDPESAELMAALSMTYIESGDLRTAQDLLEEAEAIDPADMMVQTVRAAFENRKAQHTAKAKPSQSRSKSKPKPKKKR